MKKYPFLVFTNFRVYIKTISMSGFLFETTVFGGNKGVCVYIYLSVGKKE